MQSSIAEINRVSMRSGGMYSRNSSPYSSGGFRSSGFSGSGASLNTGLSVMCSPPVTGGYTEPFSPSPVGSSPAAPLSPGYPAHSGGYMTGGYANTASCRAAQMSITDTKSMIQDLTYRRNSMGGSSRGVTAH